MMRVSGYVVSRTIGERGGGVDAIFLCVWWEEGFGDGCMEVYVYF
jgi:hypothetical protein